MSGENFDDAKKRIDVGGRNGLGIKITALLSTEFVVDSINTDDCILFEKVSHVAIEALKKIWHRGAVDADGKTGDGAGIHVQIPWEFVKEHIRHTGHEPADDKIAVGMVFLPKADLGAQEVCRSIVETEILRAGYSIYGWRQVPINVDVIGEKANASRPEIEQIMLSTSPEISYEDFERDLYVVRRRIERRVLAEHINDFYICSLSCRSVRSAVIC